MTQEDKQLLLTDLCARLPYGVIISWCNEKVEHKRFILESITSKKYKSYKENGKELAINGEYIEWKLNEHGKNFYTIGEFIKPYLRLMSSMTEKEKEELFQLMGGGTDVKRIDFYISHHFDYRGLIEKGLAIEVTEENNPYKE